MVVTMLATADAAGCIRAKGKRLVSRTILILATMVVMLVVVGGVALAREDCQYEATGWNCYCSPGVFCEGTNNGEIVWGSDSGDTIHAYGGNDEIYAGYGNDSRVVGGDGDDLISGGPGNDRCDGGNGYDRARGCEFTVRVEGTW